MIFELALQKAALPASDVWYCGDNLYADVYGAHNAGLFPVHYDERSVENAWHMEIPDMKMDFEYLHINNWLEFIDIIKKL